MASGRARRTDSVGASSSVNREIFAVPSTPRSGRQPPVAGTPRERLPVKAQTPSPELSRWAWESNGLGEMASPASRAFDERPMLGARFEMDDGDISDGPSPRTLRRARRRNISVTNVKLSPERRREMLVGFAIISVIGAIAFLMAITFEASGGFDIGDSEEDIKAELWAAWSVANGPSATSLPLPVLPRPVPRGRTSGGDGSTVTRDNGTTFVYRNSFGGTCASDAARWRSRSRVLDVCRTSGAELTL